MAFNFLVFRLAKFFVQILGARFLSSKEFGVFSYIYALLDIFNNLLGAGIEVAASRFFKKEAHWSILWRHAAILRAGFSFAGFLSGIFILGWPHGYLFGLWHIFYLQDRLFYSYLNTLLYPRGIIISGLASEGVLLAASILGLKFWGLEGLIMAFVLERAVASICLAGFVNQRCPALFSDVETFPPSFKDGAAKLLRASSPVWAVQALGILASRLDTIVIKKILGFEALAFYSLAFRAAEAPLFIFAAISDTSLAYFIRHAEQKEDIYERSLRSAGVFGFASALAIFVFSFFAGKIFGPQYESLGALMAGYSWILALKGPNMVASSFLLANAQERLLLLSAGIGIILSLAGNIVLLPIFSLRAAALLAVVNEAVVFLTRQFGARRGGLKEILFSVLIVTLSFLSLVFLS